MKLLGGLLAALFVVAGIGASNAGIRIAQDPGGRIETYVGKYQGVRSSGERLIIDGSCVSACTIVLGTVPHDRICVTSRARLGFHAAWFSYVRVSKITTHLSTLPQSSMYPFSYRLIID